MFLVDKYYEVANNLVYNHNIINKVIDSFDAHNLIYNNIDDVMKKPDKEFINIITDLVN